MDPYHKEHSVSQMGDEEIVIENQDELKVGNERENPGGSYSADDIKVEKSFYTVYELKRKYDKAEKLVVLDSDFQRDNVWNEKQKSELVESVLLGLPLPIFYLNQDKYGKLIVVDGRQRLTALFDYMDNKYALRKLQILDQLNGKNFKDLEPINQTQIEDFQLQAHVIAAQTPEQVKYDIFDRVNRGGTKLNKQEIRNALYQGKATDLLKNLSSTTEFTEATGESFKNEKHMKDRYLLIRALGMYIYSLGVLEKAGRKYQYRGNIDELLGLTMDYINRLSDADVDEIRRLLMEALIDSRQCFGQDAFRKPAKEKDRRNPINMNYFETIIVAFMIYENCRQIGNVDSSIVSDCLHQLVYGEWFENNIVSNRDSASKFNERLMKSLEAGRGIFKNDKEANN